LGADAGKDTTGCFPCGLEGREDAGTKPVIGVCTGTKPVIDEPDAGVTVAVGAAARASGEIFNECPDSDESSVFAKTDPQNASVRKVVSTRFLIRSTSILLI
jgi:hypothetical protein